MGKNGGESLRRCEIKFNPSRVKTILRNFANSIKTNLANAVPAEVGTPMEIIGIENL